ncbi:Methyltransferase [Beijerinckiaceae bacterium RH AL1]|nr:50S ribosomal protein L11 methyltransferase [Beijerinckiaceae bacterium]VVB46335.1 Methyltransferase [Beijerinckiaceae bacterium RH CH11]VVB46420.1 Methyltransferase [Beijerinckiaceae bacterium RH AL8]VVC55323.1 Methyltransferase [Beijerinckiaceae bacterium RH AL1]
MIDGETLSRFIAAELPLTPARSVPEVSLHLAVPTSGLHRLGLRHSPYWAYQWAGGTALARYILDTPEIVALRRVLDLGCGGGLVAIAAAKAGALKVSAIDIDFAAVAATRLAAQANEVEIAAACADGLVGEPPRVDLILAGDLFYARRLAARATAFLARCRAAGVDVLVGDPGRAPLPVDRLRKLADVAVPDFGDGSEQPASVYAFRSDGAGGSVAPAPITAASGRGPW